MYENKPTKFLLPLWRVMKAEKSYLERRLESNTMTEFELEVYDTQVIRMNKLNRELQQRGIQFSHRKNIFSKKLIIKYK